ncbi:MAG: hypothetical protein OIN86_16635 [Candidatus Methanoperedens sp.]|nr:hypothetical protein [Candidatus Methanoperedens sp.]
MPPELAQEIGSRDDAISFLKDILQNDDYWNHSGLGDAWGAAGQGDESEVLQEAEI